MDQQRSNITTGFMFTNANLCLGDMGEQSAHQEQGEKLKN